ncbi:hypothetical protein M3Y99_00954200 [Aphelenchoides fujianensis]|nr:hypothetical protein M3Y99_00954200 [Aphelenchoides fujianensis]
MEDWPSISHLYIWPESARLHQSNDAARPLVYTMPVLKHEQPLSDEMPEAVQKLRGQPAARPAVSSDLNGLKTLIKQGHFKAAFNLTTSLLQFMGHSATADKRTGVTFDSLKLWNCRFQLLMSLKMHRVAVEEMSAFEELDAPDLFFQHNPELRARGFVGSMVPFNLRLIHAEVLQFTPTPWSAWTRLSKLEAAVESILQMPELPGHARNVWKQRLEVVKTAEARLLYSLKARPLLLSLPIDCLQEFEQSVALFERIAADTADKKKAAEIQRFLVRVGMLLGNSRMIEQKAESPLLDANWTKFMRQIFTSNYEKAAECLKTADVGGTEDCNNRAVCSLYTGDVKQSMELLLSNRQLPPMPLLLNLYTVAELASTKARDLRSQHFAQFADQMPDLFSFYLSSTWK